MKYEYYTYAKLGQIILDLIYLHYEMDRDGHTDPDTLKGLATTIDMLKYYRQFLKYDKKGK